MSPCFLTDLTPKEEVAKMSQHDGQDNDGETPSKKRRLGEETEKDQASTTVLVLVKLNKQRFQTTNFLVV